jgi:Arc/MetJ-type ribon-helix-helix transcriptional regulator
MPKKPQAYMAALPASALPELQELMERFAGPEARRSNVVMMRLSDAPLRHVDQLVEAGLFASRSEAAAFLVGAGIEAYADLFDKAARHTEQIKRIKQVLREEVPRALRSAPRRKAPRGRR